jgi:hypothetical protein
LARALHPDFGLFWPSPGLRKLSVAVAFTAIGLMAGTNSLVLLLNEPEPAARDAFALAPAETRTPLASSTESSERALPSTETNQSQMSHPKVIWVERKPIKPSEVKHARTNEVTSDCSSLSQSQPRSVQCRSAEQQAPLAGSGNSLARSMTSVQESGVETLPSNATVITPAEPPASAGEEAPARVMSETMPAPLQRESRKITQTTQRKSRTLSYARSRAAAPQDSFRRPRSNPQAQWAWAWGWRGGQQRGWYQPYYWGRW